MSKTIHELEYVTLLYDYQKIKTGKHSLNMKEHGGDPRMVFIKNYTPKDFIFSTDDTASVPILVKKREHVLVEIPHLLGTPNCFWYDVVSFQAVNPKKNDNTQAPLIIIVALAGKDVKDDTH